MKACSQSFGTMLGGLDAALERSWHLGWSSTCISDNFWQKSEDMVNRLTFVAWLQRFRDVGTRCCRAWLRLLVYGRCVHSGRSSSVRS